MTQMTIRDDLRVVARHIHAGSRVLDLGCGDGELLNWLIRRRECTGSGVERQPDAVLAATSHLPHLLAYTLVDTLARLDDRAEIFRYAAGGFRDFTRIASSDPTMWRDICVANREQLLEMIALFNADLAQLAEAIRNDDRAAILTTFQRAKRARDNLYLE